MKEMEADFTQEDPTVRFWLVSGASDWQKDLLVRSLRRAQPKAQVIQASTDDIRMIAEHSFWGSQYFIVVDVEQTDKPKWLLQQLDYPPELNSIVMVTGSEEAKRRKWVDQVAKKSKTLKLKAPKTKKDWVAWLEGQWKRAGIQPQGSASDHFLDRTPQDEWTRYSTVEMLRLTLPSNEITVNDIDELVKDSEDDMVWEIQSALMAGNWPKIKKIIYATDAEPLVAKIVATTAINGFLVMAMQEEAVEDSKIQEIMGFKNFQWKRYKNLRRSQSAVIMRELLEAVWKLDNDFKSNRLRFWQDEMTRVIAIRLLGNLLG